MRVGRKHERRRKKKEKKKRRLILVTHFVSEEKENSRHSVYSTLSCLHPYSLLFCHCVFSSDCDIFVLRLPWYVVLYFSDLGPTLLWRTSDRLWRPNTLMSCLKDSGESFVGYVRCFFVVIFFITSCLCEWLFLRCEDCGWKLWWIISRLCFFKKISGDQRLHTSSSLQAEDQCTVGWNDWISIPWWVVFEFVSLMDSHTIPGQHN